MPLTKISYSILVMIYVKSSIKMCFSEAVIAASVISDFVMILSRVYH